MNKKEEKISDRIARFRKQKNLSAAEVAKYIGVAVSTYREWEYGRAITGEPYLKLAQILGVSLLELLTGQHNIKPQILQELELAEQKIKRAQQLLAPYSD